MGFCHGFATVGGFLGRFGQAVTVSEIEEVV